MYCEYLEFYFPKVCYFLLIWLLKVCYFFFQHDSDHLFSSVLSLLGLLLDPLCPDQTSDISGFSKENSGKVCLIMGQWDILDCTSISLTF